MAEEGLITDGSNDFLAGQNAALIPDRIPANAYAAGINISVKRASITPRWGFNRKTLTFSPGVVSDQYLRERNYRDLFTGGKFQAMVPYSISGVDHLIIIIAGTIYLVNIDTFDVKIISIADGSNLNRRAERLYTEVAAKYLIVHDYPANPVIIDGFTARRADASLMEVPVSVMGGYNQNRLVVVNAGNEFTAGDVVGNLSTPGAPITFEEVFTVGSPYYSQIFQLPTLYNDEPVTALGFMQSVDSSTGIGPLIIGTNKAIYSFQTQLPRSQWAAGSFGSILVNNSGIAGPRALANVNLEMFYFSSDGYARTLSMSRNEQRRWTNIPISREVDNWLNPVDASLVKFNFVTYFRNKIFFSAKPYRVAVEDYDTRLPIDDVAFEGLVVLELDNVTSFGEASKPTWAGLWTGVHPMEAVTINDRCFIISKDEQATNQLYEVTPEVFHDTTDTDIRYVRSIIYTREFDFKNPFENKEMHSIDFNFDTLKGNFKIDVSYKPSHSPYFLPWGNFEHCAPWSTCGIPEGCLINGFASHHIRDFTLGSPSSQEQCNPVTKDYYNVFRKSQLRLELTGAYWEIHEFRMKAAVRPLSMVETTCSGQTNPVTLCEQCFNDLYVPPFESCFRTV